MRLLKRLTDERFARSAAGVIKVACYFVIGFLVLCTILSFLGRQTFTLHSKTGTYERAICAEEDHGRHSRSMTVYTGDDIHVWTDDGDQIEPAVRIGLSVLYAATRKAMLGKSCSNRFPPVPMDSPPSEIRLTIPQTASLMNGTKTAAKNWISP